MKKYSIIPIIILLTYTILIFPKYYYKNSDKQLVKSSITDSYSLAPSVNVTFNDKINALLTDNSLCIDVTDKYSGKAQDYSPDLMNSIVSLLPENYEYGIVYSKLFLSSYNSFNVYRITNTTSSDIFSYNVGLYTYSSEEVYGHLLFDLESMKIISFSGSIQYYPVSEAIESEADEEYLKNTEEEFISSLEKYYADVDNWTYSMSQSFVSPNELCIYSYNPSIAFSTPSNLITKLIQH